MHKIVYLPVAQNDLFQALEYLTVTLDAPGAAADLLDEFDRAIQQIAQFPYVHELYRTDRPMKDEIRKVPIKNSPSSSPAPSSLCRTAPTVLFHKYTGQQRCCPEIRHTVLREIGWV